MNRIIKKEKLAENIFLMQIAAPEIAQKTRAGNFVILKIDENGERIPLTIADYDNNTITIVFQAVGKTTNELAKLKEGDKIADLLGPLGNKSDIKTFGNVCLIAGGVGAAMMHLLAKELKKEQNTITTIIGARNKDLIFWEKRFEDISDELIICTDDGSKGKKGFVSHALKEFIDDSQHFDMVFVVGPVIMMKAIADLTRDRIKTVASLNPIMIDGTGMCGCCRVTVDGAVRFACVDGPEFDAHLVDFNELINRNSRFVEEEKHICRIGLK